VTRGFLVVLDLQVREWAVEAKQLEQVQMNMAIGVLTNAIFKGIQNACPHPEHHYVWRSGVVPSVDTSVFTERLNAMLDDPSSPLSVTDISVAISSQSKGSFATVKGSHLVSLQVTDPLKLLQTALQWAEEKNDVRLRECCVGICAGAEVLGTIFDTYQEVIGRRSDEPDSQAASEITRWLRAVSCLILLDCADSLSEPFPDPKTNFNRCATTKRILLSRHDRTELLRESLCLGSRPSRDQMAIMVELLPLAYRHDVCSLLFNVFPTRGFMRWGWSSGADAGVEGWGWRFSSTGTEGCVCFPCIKIRGVGMMSIVTIGGRGTFVEGSLFTDRPRWIETMYQGKLHSSIKEASSLYCWHLLDWIWLSLVIVVGVLLVTKPFDATILNLVWIAGPRSIGIPIDLYAMLVGQKANITPFVLVAAASTLTALAVPTRVTGYLYLCSAAWCVMVALIPPMYTVAVDERVTNTVCIKPTRSVWVGNAICAPRVLVQRFSDMRLAYHYRGPKLSDATWTRAVLTGLITKCLVVCAAGDEKTPRDTKSIQDS